MDRNIKDDGSYSIIVKSLSARRAWIEIYKYSIPYIYILVSLSARRAWIEIKTRTFVSQTVKSLSARRAWIEIISFLVASLLAVVALRKESVDRNWLPYRQY